MIEQVAFLVLAAVVLGSAVGVVAARSVFLSALWLVVTFIGVAGLYVLLDAGFLATVQVLVYVGAISVLILFAIMLTHDIMAEPRPTNRNWVLGLLACVALFGVLAAVAYRGEWRVVTGTVAASTEMSVPVTAEVGPGGLAAHEGMVARTSEDGSIAFVVPAATAALGRTFMTTYLLPFEIVGVMLLVALVGAIVIARE